MAEIKSTIELVMERTRGLVLSQEEKDDLKREEHLGAIAGHVQKFVDGVWTMEQVEEALLEIQDEFRAAAAIRLKELLLGGMDAGEESRRRLEALDRLASPGDRDHLDELKRLLESYDRSRREAVLARETAVRERLAAVGISGDAIEISPAVGQEWQEEARGIEHRLESVKAKWAASLQSPA